MQRTSVNKSILTLVIVVLPIWAFASGCCDATCQINLANEWEKKISERCNWMMGKSVYEIEKKFTIIFPRNEIGKLDRGTTLSEDGVTEIDLRGCGSWCGAPENTDGDYSKVPCADGGAADAASLDKYSYCFETSYDAGPVGVTWVCNNCPFGPEDCCDPAIWFLDQPEPLTQVTRTRDCPTDTKRDKRGCTIEIQKATEVVRRILGWNYYSDPLLEDCH